MLVSYILTDDDVAYNPTIVNNSPGDSIPAIITASKGKAYSITAFPAGAGMIMRDGVAAGSKPGQVVIPKGSE